MQEKTKNIDFNILIKLCEYQCTPEEIYATLDIGAEELDIKVKTKYGISFREFRLKHAEGGKAYIRKSQFQQAGNSVPMSIWLGKQYLGQRDVIDTGEAEKLLAAAETLCVKVKNGFNKE